MITIPDICIICQSKLIKIRQDMYDQFNCNSITHTYQILSNNYDYQNAHYIYIGNDQFTISVNTQAKYIMFNLKSITYFEFSLENFDLLLSKLKIFSTFD